MKLSNKIIFALLICVSIITGCKKDNGSIALNKPVTLKGPLNSSTVEINIDGAESVVFEWSALPDAGANVKYYVLFDKGGTLFSQPVDSIISDNAGVSTKLTLTHQQLDLIAGKAGIGAKKTGLLYWAIDAVSDGKIITSVAVALNVKRPTGLGVVPDVLYLTGSSTETGVELANAIPFKKVSNGLFEAVTSLKTGTYKILSGKDASAKQYYFQDSILFRGTTDMEYTGTTAPVIIRVDFNNSVGLQKIIFSTDVVVTATLATIATLTYKGNHLFDGSNIVFSFLTPGGPGAPSWLGWVEERYKFRFKTDGSDEFFGSPMDGSMGASSDPTIPAFNGRPEGAEPQGYFNLYNVDLNDQWAGCFKFASQFDGRSMKISMFFNPAKYYHSVTVN